MENSFPLEVYWTLLTTFHQLKRDLHNKLAESGITWPQFHALCHIEDGGTYVNELARELNCNASNITGLIDRMVENNWVYREHCEEDRRMWLVKLTEEGVKLKARLIPEYQKNIEKRMSVLDEHELSTLKALLEKLANNEAKEQAT